jgi:hypothetical protein
MLTTGHVNSSVSIHSFGSLADALASKISKRLRAPLFQTLHTTPAVQYLVIPYLDTIQVDKRSLCNTSVAVLERLKEKVEKLGRDVSTHDGAHFEECERELEQERVKESEKEMEFTRMHPFVEDDWDYSKMFTLDSPYKLEWTHQMRLSATEIF